jgi:hypothetical protein
MTGRPRIRVSNRTGCALPQLRTSAKFHSSAKCHKCQPHAGSDDVSYDPIRSPTLLKDRRRVGAHHDVGQRSAQRGMARRPEVGEKCVQLSSLSQISAPSSLTSRTGAVFWSCASWSIDSGVDGTIGAPLGCSLIATTLRGLITASRATRADDGGPRLTPAATHIPLQVRLRRDAQRDDVSGGLRGAGRVRRHATTTGGRPR